MKNSSIKHLLIILMVLLIAALVAVAGSQGSITLIAVPVLSGWQWVIIISPVFVTLLPTRVSGIPLLEARAAKRWGKDPEYQLYLATTPRLIPLPRSRSASQPDHTIDT